MGEAEYVNARSGESVEKVSWNSGELNRQGAIGRDNGSLRRAPTLGWSDCACISGFAHRGEARKTGNDKYRRGHVLDPFAGSGTTLAAAAEQGRDATGIDLDPRNLHLARERIGLFLEETA